MPSALWAVRAALVTTFKTAVGSVPVIDGPRAKTTPEKLFVLVGTDGGETSVGDGDEDGAVITQRLSTLGPGTWRDELGQITCAVWAWTGDTDLAPLRTNVAGVLDALENALRADRTLGGTVDPPGIGELTEVRFRETQTDKGAVLRATFTIAYQSLLTT